MFTNMQRHMLRHIVLLCHWLQNCKLGHDRRLRLRSHRRIRRQSSRIHVHTADSDATRQNSFDSSASAVCIGLNVAQWHVRLRCPLPAVAYPSKGQILSLPFHFPLKGPHFPSSPIPFSVSLLSVYFLSIPTISTSSLPLCFSWIWGRKISLQFGAFCCTSATIL